MQGGDASISQKKMAKMIGVNCSIIPVNQGAKGVFCMVLDSFLIRIHPQMKLLKSAKKEVMIH